MMLMIMNHNSGTAPRTGGSLVEHRAVMREAVSSTQAGPTLMVLKNN